MEKTYLIHKQEYHDIDKRLIAPCNFGTLTWDLTIIVKDNKFKLTSDNFRWVNTYPGSPCKNDIYFTPMPTTRPNGLTKGPFWDDLIKIIPMIIEKFYNQIKITNTQSDF
jgi:hypothetical protein